MTTERYTDTLLETLRRNVSILGELAVRYGVETHPPRPADPPAVYSPEAVRLLLAPEMAPPRPGAVPGPPAGHKDPDRGPAGDLPGGRELHHRQTGGGVPARRH